MKICTKCNESKSEDRFSFRSKSKGTRNPWCKDCINTHRMKLYRANWDDERAARSNYALLRRERNRDHLFEYFETHPCIDCGETDPVVLEFDHRDPDLKSYCVASKLRNCRWETLLKEIIKCDVRCANCHRRRTSKQFNWYMRK